MTALHAEIAACRHCAAHLPHSPRPVVQFSSTSRLVIVGQAPGSKVDASGIPWDDASGERLRNWTGLTRKQLYDSTRVAIVPMGFCYPGKASSGDLPPRRECAPLWHEIIFRAMPEARLTLLVGTYAQAYYLSEARKHSMTERIRSFRDHLPRFFPLPHPAWRSVIWMRQNAWFEKEVLPELRREIAGALS